MDVETRNIEVARNLQWLFLVIAALALAFSRSWAHVVPLVTVLGCGAVLNALTYAVPTMKMVERGMVGRVLQLQLALNLVIIALACGYTGGFASPLYPFLLLPLIVPAITLGVSMVCAYSLFAIVAFLLSGFLLAPTTGISSAVVFVELALLAAFPTLLSLGLAQYHRRLRDRETFATLYRVSRSLGESLDLEQVLNRLLEEVDHVYRTDISSVRLLDPGTNTLTVEASGAGKKEIVAEQIGIRLGEGFIGWVAKTGEPFITNDITEHLAFADFPRARKKVTSAIASPIKLGGRVVGVISCASSKRRRFTAEDLELLNSVASLAAAAIERAQLYQQLLSRGEAIVEGMVDGLIVVDRDCRVILTNRTARDTLDIRPSTEEPLEEIMQGAVVEYRSLCRDVRLKILEERGEAPTAFSASLTLAQRNTTLNARVSPILSHWGNVLGAALLLQDVTELMRLTTELQQEKNKLEVVLENVPAGVLAVDDSGKILIANSASYHIMGVERPWWWLGSTLADSFPERAVVKLATRALESGEEFFDRTVALGSGRHIEVSCVPIKDLAGGHDGMVLVLHDITDVRRLEQARSDFVSMVSHELRTPLTSIKAYVDTLLRDDVQFDEEARKRFVQVIARETERMIRLINDLLNLSRMEAGRLELKVTFVDLPDLVRRAVGRAGSYTEKHEVTLDLPEEIPPVLAEPEKLEQVVLNLIANAVKYSPPASEVRVSVRKLNDRAEVTVADSGIGIPEDQLPYVFDKYHQVDRTGSLAARGSGLGLYVSKTIVEAHGGRIWAESKEAAGTTVHFTVPLASPDWLPGKPGKQEEGTVG